MGALQTAMGKVGTGFTDEDREHFWDLDWNRNPDGTFKPVMIEVSCMQLTPDGKFRHPAFERIRYDK
jgi:ATP-dependent DNA ligase